MGIMSKILITKLFELFPTRMGVLTLLLSGVCEEAPGWGVDNSYEDMLKAFGTFKPPFKKIDSMMGGEFL